MKYVWYMVFVNLFMMLSEGYFQSRSNYYDFKLTKNHSMMKSKKLMDLNYDMLESEYLQDTIVELNHLETNGIYNLSSFGKSIGDFIGGILGFLISFYFSLEFFKSDFTFKNINNTTINIIFITIFLLLNIISFITVSKFNKKAGSFITQNTKKVFRYIRSYMDIIYDYKSGKDIRLYDMDLAENAGDVYRSNMYHVFSYFWTSLGKGSTISNFLNGVLSVIIFIFISMKAFYGSISIGEIMLYIGAINSIFKNALSIIKSLSIIIPSDSYREKLFNFMDLNTNIETKKVLNKEIYTNKIEIEFKNVSFKYPDTDKYVLKNINLKFNSGKKCAIVGVNGSGKTTLIKLILRLYEPTEGKILLNGENIKNYNYDNYLDIFSVVFQDFKLFSLTLGENVAVSKNYDLNEVKNSLIKVGLSEFLKKNDLTSYLYREFDENGIEISGGEAQKIAMARALYKKGKFIILDEPTAALDPISESNIYSKFNTIVQNNTAIYISHRLSSCRFCDDICVLNDGVVVQYGSHETLIGDTLGKYYELWTSQAKYYT
ncbi:ABC transporter ATP-binding protein [Clostridium ihumii]|uniref:ABC transporter ATP-binding protein n=1 Tax=Clostridium ihumii TaxID=1470356 RepID=UPI00131589BE|nr:ABC transporter ATP-binding protein [Clostridium ihumii]